LSCRTIYECRIITYFICHYLVLHICGVKRKGFFEPQIIKTSFIASKEIEQRLLLTLVYIETRDNAIDVTLSGVDIGQIIDWFDPLMDYVFVVMHHLGWYYVFVIFSR
jgi:hypothetical protein